MARAIRPPGRRAMCQATVLRNRLRVTGRSGSAGMASLSSPCSRAYLPPLRGPSSAQNQRCHGPPVPPRSCPPYVRQRLPSRAAARPQTPAHVPNPGQHAHGRARVSAGQRSIIGQPRSEKIWPTHGPQNTADGLRNRSLSALEPLTHVHVNGSELGFYVAGARFELA
jgi:hypothetical protein